MGMFRRNRPRLAHFRRTASVSDLGAARPRTGGRLSRLLVIRVENRVPIEKSIHRRGDAHASLEGGTAETLCGKHEVELQGRGDDVDEIEHRRPGAERDGWSRELIRP